MCPVCYDVWQRDVGYEGGGYAAFGEGIEHDDQMDVWSNTERQEGE